MNTDNLLPRQIPVAEHLRNCLLTHRAAVDLSDGGVGKTYVACALVRDFDVATLVVAPKSLLATWHRVGDYMNTELDAINYEKVRTGKTPYGKWVDPPRGGRGKWFRWAPEVKFLIFDEVHWCKGTTTKNAALLSAAARQGIPTLGLSATIAQSPLDMRAIGMLLKLHNGNDFYPWVRRHECRPGPFGGFIYRGGEEVMANIRKKILPDKGVRVRIEDIPDFPETQIVAELCDVEQPEVADELYEEMAEQLEALHDRSLQDKGDNPLTEILRLRQKLELLMVPIIVEQARDAMEQGYSVPIFVNFRETLYAIAEKLGTDCVLHGDVDVATRDRNVQRFQDASSRVIVCIAQVGGIGLSLHDLIGGHMRWSFILPGYCARTLKQCFWRVQREGAKTKSLQRVLFPNTRLGRRIHSVVNGKLHNLDALNDGDLQPVGLKISRK